MQCISFLYHRRTLRSSSALPFHNQALAGAMHFFFSFLFFTGRHCANAVHLFFTGIPCCTNATRHESGSTSLFNIFSKTSKQNENKKQRGNHNRRTCNFAQRKLLPGSGESSGRCTPVLSCRPRSEPGKFDFLVILTPLSGSSENDGPV